MILIYILIIIAAACFFYKIFLGYKIQRKEQGSQFSFIMSLYTFIPFFPFRKRRDLELNAMVKKGNLCLLIFYLCFILVQILSVI